MKAGKDLQSLVLTSCLCALASNLYTNTVITLLNIANIVVTVKWPIVVATMIKYVKWCRHVIVQQLLKEVCQTCCKQQARRSAHRCRAVARLVPWLVGCK